MRGGGSWLSPGLILLVAVGCNHRSSTRPPESVESWGMVDKDTRTKGGDSATLHIQALIAQGQLEAAEAYLVQAVAAGLLAREAATRLQEKIAERKQQQNSNQDRRIPPSNLKDWEIADTQRRACETEMPDLPVCHELPEEYSFHSPRQALEAMKQRLGAKTLALHGEEPADQGPCPDIGRNYNVRMNGKRDGSITCCPCCVGDETRPVLWTKCRIVW